MSSTPMSDLDYFCFKILHINFRNNTSLTWPLFADSKSRMIRKYLQFYLKYLKQNFMTKAKTSRIVAIVGTALREAIKVLYLKKLSFSRHPRHIPPSYISKLAQTKKEVTICSEEKDEI